MSLSAADLAFVRGVPMFSGLDEDLVRALLDEAVVRVLPEGGLLFGRGDVAAHFFLCLEGRVHLFALTAGGEQSIIEVVDRGQTFAEAAIFANMRYPLNAEAMPGTRLLEIPGAPFIRRLSDMPGLVPRLLASLTGWQRRLMAEIGDLKGRSPAQRLGAFLLALLQNAGSAGGEVQLPFSKAALASRIGISPESLSRALSRLKSIGVESRGRDLHVADPEALRRFCGLD
ncbi:transcriptional activator protein Anr [mine drainage metagenome]|uniref:Transcriptional activator protein Anr n=1 Tax=mine drainage metagenome TaxID=410659 RepID=A0A1J5S1S8_9ZZZZ